MKRTLHSCLRGILFSVVFLLLSFSSRASHIVGAELTYKWTTGLTYDITVVLYGDCGPSSAGAFSTLPTSTPQVCIFDAATNVGSINLTLDSSKEVTPVCPRDALLTQCHNTSYTTPGIKAFYYHKSYTLPYYSRTWRFVYTGSNGGGSAAGRAAAITNLVTPGSTIMQLIDTLDNYALVNSRQHNSSPLLTVLPTPFFCINTTDCYNPGAVDLYDVSSPSEPSGDSLRFSLIAATNGTQACGTVGGDWTYTGTAWTPPSTPVSGTTPLRVTAGTFSFDPGTGQLCFFPPVLQRAVVVYNIDEYRNDTIGEITTIAGTGAAGFSGDGGPALSAALNSPTGMCSDPTGAYIYFCDSANNRIRVIDGTGLITTVAGNGVAGYCGDGGVASSAEINGPMGITFTGGNLVFADYYNHAIRKITLASPITGVITTIAGSNVGTAGFKGDGFAAAGYINTIAGTGFGGFTGDGAAATGAEIKNPTGFVMDGANNIYFSDAGNNVIRKITAGGIISTIAGTPGTAGYCGDGAAASAALLNNPQGLAITGTSLYVADAGNNVVRLINTGTGIITTVAGNTGGVAGLSGDGSFAVGGSVSTFAGSGTAGYTGDASLATLADIHGPQGICKNTTTGNIYFADSANNVIRMVTPLGIISTIAGSTAGLAGYSGDGAAASAARLNGPVGLGIDNTGNLYFSDNNNNVIRKIATTGIITTVVGTGAAGFNSDGAALTRQLDHPTGIAVDPAGAAVWFSDAGNQRVRLYSIGGGTVTTIAGTGTAGYSGDGATGSTLDLNNPDGLAYTAAGAGTLYIADAGNNRVRALNLTTSIMTTVAGTGTPGSLGDGGAAVSAQLNDPTGVAADAYGNIYIADRGNNKIRKTNVICPIISTVAGTGTAGSVGDGGIPTAAEFNTITLMMEDAAGDLYISDLGNNKIRKITPCDLNHPTGVAVNTANTALYIADANNDNIRLVNLSAGTITTYAGTGSAGYAGDPGLISGARFNLPTGLYLNSGTNMLYIADAGNNRVRRINIIAGTIANFAGNGTAGYCGDGLAITHCLNNPTSVYGDVTGNIFIADNADNLIRRIDPCGNMITFAGNGVAAYGPDLVAPGSSKINQPNSVYVDPLENVYITDYANNRIRQVYPAELRNPVGVAADGATPANIYFSDNGNQRIRKINGTTGVITTIAGTGVVGATGDGAAATGALLNSPFGLFWDNATSFLYIADAGNNRVRYINTGTGTMNAFAGFGTAGYGGDGRSATAVTALMRFPTDMYKDAAGNMLISDNGNNCIREVTPTGFIYTLAGTTVAGFSGDLGDPVLAQLNKPLFLIGDPTRDIYITDNVNNRIRKILPNAIIKPGLVGTMQREMTFLVLTCTATAPDSAYVDTVGAGSPGILTPDGTHYTVCGNTGDMNLYFDPREPGDTSDITVTATGLPTGSSFNVTANNSPFAHAVFNIPTTLGVVNPGTYTFYVTFQDNHCPLVGSKTTAITITILPVPTIRDSLVTNATCATAGVIKIFPGGTGKPWTIKVSHPAPALDTFQVFTNDSLAFLDTVSPGNDTVTIYTSAGGECHVGIPLIIPVPSFSITATFTNPTYCGAKDGSIVIYGLSVGSPDTVSFFHDGVIQPDQPFIVSSIGSDTIKTLYAGAYTNLYAIEGFCHTDSLTVNLTNPLFTFRSISPTNPTKCGFCNGVDTIFGLHPGQLDTISYQRTLPGSPIMKTSFFVTSDSMVVITGLCDSTYKNIVVNTGGVCLDSLPGPRLIQPHIHAAFDSLFHFGCLADTVNLTNYSTPASDLTYLWTFGDGGTSFETNPQHIYYSTVNSAEKITLHITNTRCYDSTWVTFTLNNFVHSVFTFAPDPFVCQNVPVAYTNLSTGANPYTNALPAYMWYFGDGSQTSVTNPTHTYQNTGKYPIMLVAATDVPCYDTSIQYISIDSNSVISIQATDSVLCVGQGITFTGIFSNIGDTLTSWSFGDGSNILNVNPVIHSYENAPATNPYTVTLDVKYRSCPEKVISRTVSVFGNPSIYLGPDLAMCPGSNALTLVDERNESNSKASWMWNTGETTPSINVVKPGYYSAVVTIDGCSSSDTVWVQKDCYMDIPNVFSPNNDGTNDYFFPRQMLTKGVSSFKMNIYNRWGQVVYETTNTDGRGWDGTFNGVPQPEGVYVYMIDATFKDGQIEHHQGNITLLR